MIGQEIGNYKIIDLIGKGGMAVVYLGQHKALTRRTVAIKMLSASLESDSAFNERFFREAEVMDRLTHPNIVTLYDFIEHEGRYFIVMEYISGPTLAHLIQERGGPLPLEEVSSIFKQVLDAIGYAHDLGIVHRDLKPSNIMIDQGGQVKITDFGIARLLGTGFEATLTTTGMGMGSPFYMSPEQVLASKEHPITAASDIYSLGITLYQAVTGKVPFNGGDSLFTIMQAHLKEPPPSPREFAPHVSPQLERVILKAIEKRPEERWKDCAEFWENLRRAITETLAQAPAEPSPLKDRPAQEELPTVTLGPTVTTPLGAEAKGEPETSKRPIALILALVLVLLAGGAGAAYYFLVHKGAEAPPPRATLEEPSGPVAERAEKVTKEPSGQAQSLALAIKEARQLLEADDYDGALDKVKEVLAVQPDNEDALLIQSLAFKAKKVKLVQERLLQGEAAYAAGNYRAALQNADAALELDPDDSKAKELARRARAKLQELEKKKKEIAVMLAKAEAYLDSGSFGKAEEEARRVLANAPDHPKAKEILEKARQKRKRQAVERKLKEATALMDAGKFHLAISKLDQALRLEPNNPRAKSLKREALARLKAKPDKQKIIERRLALAEDLISAQQYEKAKIILNKILDEDPDNKRAQDLLELAEQGQQRKLLQQFLPALVPGSSPQDLNVPGLGQPGQ